MKTGPGDVLMVMFCDTGAVLVKTGPGDVLMVMFCTVEFRCCVGEDWYWSCVDGDVLQHRCCVGEDRSR